jgi:excisionase family DNA binding protein
MTEPAAGERSLLILEAARRLGVSRRTVYYRIRDGLLRTIRTRGGSQRVLLSSIEQLQQGPSRPGGEAVSESETLPLEIEPLA